eukprot:scaffold740_cov405-Prasinococcus_capsulatus_cf.AAC.10
MRLAQGHAKRNIANESQSILTWPLAAGCNRRLKTVAHRAGAPPWGGSGGKPSPLLVARRRGQNFGVGGWVTVVTRMPGEATPPPLKGTGDLPPMGSAGQRLAQRLRRPAAATHRCAMAPLTSKGNRHGLGYTGWPAAATRSGLGSLHWPPAGARARAALVAQGAFVRRPRGEGGSRRPGAPAPGFSSGRFRVRAGVDPTRLSEALTLSQLQAGSPVLGGLPRDGRGAQCRGEASRASRGSSGRTRTCRRCGRGITRE